jgi:hypothetical protein
MPAQDRATDGQEVSLPAGAAFPSDHIGGPSASILRKADIPRAPKTGFEEGLLMGDSLEPAPRFGSDAPGDDLEGAPSGPISQHEDQR